MNGGELADSSCKDSKTRESENLPDEKREV